MTKKDLISGKYYWAKKNVPDAKFKYIVEIAGTAPFMYVKRCVTVNMNGDTGMTSPVIDNFADEFIDANFPVM